MRIRTAVALVVVLSALGSATAVGLTTSSTELTERWISDTPRDTRVNHHGIGTGPDGVVVAPVSRVGGAENMAPNDCALVRLAPDTGAVRWRAGVAPANCTTHALTKPAIATADGTRSETVFAASTERALHAWDVTTGQERWRVPLSTYGYGQPALFERDGKAPAVVVSDIGGEVSFVANQSVRWRHDLDASTWASPIVADVDGRPGREILVGTNQHTTALTPEGEVAWQSAGAGEYVALGPPGDGSRLVIVSRTSAIEALDGASGRSVWTQNVSGSAAIESVTTDGPVPTLYAGLSDGRVLALDARTGERRWLTRLDDADQVITPPPAVGDLNGDSTTQVVAVTSTGLVTVLDGETGSVRASYSRDVPIYTAATVADVTGDGVDELFIRYGDGRVVALEYR